MSSAFSSANHSGLESVPEGWTATSLGEICDQHQENVDPAAASENVYVGLEHIQPGNPRLTNWGTPSDVQSAKSRFRASDILYGKLRPYLDKAILADRSGICSTDILVFRCRDGRVLPEFLIHALHTRELINHAIRTTHGVNHPRTSWVALRQFVLLLPRVDEQRRIARVLSTIQRAIEAQDKVIAAARELKRSLMKYLFTYGPVPVTEASRVPLRETEIGPVPEQWEVKPVARIATLLSGGTPSKMRPDWWQGNIPWASSKDLKSPRLADTEDHITAEALDHGSRVVRAGTLLVAVRGMALAKGIPVCLTLAPMAFNQDLKAVVPNNPDDAEYMLYAVEQGKHRLSPEIGSSAHGTKRLGTDALARFALPFPPRCRT